MADFINKIRTSSGDKQINYDALANLPAKNLAPGTNINNVMEPGIYAGAYTANYNDHPYTMPFMLLVSTHNTLDGFDNSTTCQIRVYCDPMSEQPSDIVQRRIWTGREWDNWVSIGDEIINISPSGGDVGEFRLLSEITADGETMYWTVTKDADGNDLNVHEVYMEITHADESGYQSIWLNGIQEFVRQKVSKGYLEPIYISLQSNLLSGIVGRHSAGVNTSNTIFNSKIVSYNAITEIKTGGYGTSVLPVGTTIKIYAR